MAPMILLKQMKNSLMKMMIRRMIDRSVFPVNTDDLMAILKKYLGNGSRYPEIKALNGLTSNTIYSGWKLKIPN
mgnify:CR=1 FL=1